jgi:hypothetical protein
MLELSSPGQPHFNHITLRSNGKANQQPIYDDQFGGSSGSGQVQRVNGGAPFAFVEAESRD